MYYSS
jgi:hypothetical protein